MILIHSAQVRSGLPKDDCPLFFSYIVKSDVALKKLADLCKIDIKVAKSNGRTLLNFAKSFEKQYPNLKNLKQTYADELGKL